MHDCAERDIRDLICICQSLVYFISYTKCERETGARTGYVVDRFCPDFRVLYTFQTDPNGSKIFPQSLSLGRGTV
jgi:hypothetical protein